MKWILISLFVINLVLVSMQWLDSRNTVLPQSYSQEPGAKELTLLNEIKGRQKVNKQEGDVCLLLGPLDTEVSANELLFLIGGESRESSLVVHELKKAPSYWVYFDEFGARDVSEWLAEFKLKNFDSYVIPAGNLAGFLSLGVFENIDLAYRLKKLLKKKGYQAKITEKSNVDKEFWLLLSASYAAENKQKIDEILTPLKKMHEKREIMCKSVASEK